MLINRPYYHKTRKTFHRLVIVGMLVTAGIFSFNPAVKAQNPQNNISDDDIIKFAEAVLEIEPFRQQAYEQIQKIIGAPPPNIHCHNPNDLNNLNEEIRTIASDYCNSSKNIVENSGLSVSQFNEIKKTLDANPNSNLVQRIQDAMLQLQRQQLQL